MRPYQLLFGLKKPSVEDYPAIQAWVTKKVAKCSGYAEAFALLYRAHGKGHPRMWLVARAYPFVRNAMCRISASKPRIPVKKPRPCLG